MNQSQEGLKTEILQNWKETSDTPGQYLMALRELHKKSIKEIASEVGVGVDQIEALEADDKHKLPAPIYVKNYIKRYCLSLGITEDEISEMLNPASQNVTPALARVSLQKSSNIRQTLVQYLGYGLIGLVVLALLYGLMSLNISSIWEAISSSSTTTESTATELSLPIVTNDETQD